SSFFLNAHGTTRNLHSFPTRRSSDLKNLVAEEKWEEASEIARRQVRGGAQVVDVCLQSTERDEKKDIPPFYGKLIRKVKAPLMRSEEHTSELQSRFDLVCRLLLEKKK